MPTVNGRLTCCQCGADLGDASDPYRDPDCMDCINREAQNDWDNEQEARTREAMSDAPVEPTRWPDDDDLPF